MGALFDIYWDELTEYKQKTILEVLDGTEDELAHINNFRDVPLVEDIFIGDLEETLYGESHGHYEEFYRRLFLKSIEKMNASRLRYDRRYQSDLLPDLENMSALELYDFAVENQFDFNNLGIPDRKILVKKLKKDKMEETLYGESPRGTKGPINPDGPTTPEDVADEIDVEEKTAAPVEVDTIGLFRNAVTPTEKEFIQADADKAGDIDDYSYYVGMLDSIDFLEVALENAENSDLDRDAYLEGIIEKLSEVI